MSVSDERPSKNFMATVENIPSYTLIYHKNDFTFNQHRSIPEISRLEIPDGDNGTKNAIKSNSAAFLLSRALLLCCLKIQSGSAEINEKNRKLPISLSFDMIIESKWKCFAIQ